MRCMQQYIDKPFHMHHMGSHTLCFVNLSPCLEGQCFHSRSLSQLKIVPQVTAAYNINLALVFLLVSVLCDTTLAKVGMKE